MRKYLFLFLIFFCLALVSADSVEAKKMYAPDLTISRLSLSQGSFTVANKGSKNSPASGFDVLIYYQHFNGSAYKKVYHCSQSISPGYSRNYANVFTGGKTIKNGLIRVNPYKRFQEIDYNNNIRYFQLIKKNTASYVATEQGSYDGGKDWKYADGFEYGLNFDNGQSGTYSNYNNGYAPLLSTNPIATGYYYYLGYINRKHRWEWRNNPLYVDYVDINANYGGKKYPSNYVLYQALQPSKSVSTLTAE